MRMIKRKKGTGENTGKRDELKIEKKKIQTRVERKGWRKRRKLRIIK